MKTLILSILLLLNEQFVYSQAEIHFDTLKYDLGNIVESPQTLKKEIYYTNTGNEPLIIQRASTGDGGSYATWDKEPIAPGKKGKIVFVYDQKRIGPFNRSITIQSNAKNYTHVVTVKGVVVYKKTTIRVSKTEINLGVIDFDSIGNFAFDVYNSGNATLHFHFNSYKNNDIDLLSLNIKDSTNSNYYWSGNYVCEPGQSLKIRGTYLNLFGNAGYFERDLVFHYNSTDSVTIRVNGTYICSTNCTDKLVKGIYSKDFHRYYYSNNRLEKIEQFNFDERLYREYIFSDAYCTRILQYKYVEGTKTVENEKQFIRGKLVAEIRN